MSPGDDKDFLATSGPVTGPALARRPDEATGQWNLFSCVGDAMSGVLGGVHSVGCVLAHPPNGVAAG